MCGPVTCPHMWSHTHTHTHTPHTQHATELCVAVGAASHGMCVGRKRASLEDACVMCASQSETCPHTLFFFHRRFGGESHQNASAFRLQPMTGSIKPWCPLSGGEIVHSLPHRNMSEKISKVAGLRVFPQEHPSLQARYWAYKGRLTISKTRVLEIYPRRTQIYRKK